MATPVVRANIEVHTRMADSYNTLEPHFRPENQAKVRRVLEELSQRSGRGKLLDLGCGTGFIINLARDLFAEIHGVDITQAMLDKVDRSSGNITLHNTTAERLPFVDNTFDMVSAYSFLHHAENYRLILREAARVLKPGGICYVDLEPNKLFWEQLERLPQGDAAGISAILRKARDSVTKTDQRVQEQFGIPADVFNQAEYGKSILGGIDPREVEQHVAALGFSACAIRYEWFLGQGDVMHGQSFEDAAKIEAYLRAILPVSAPLFKYLQFVLTK
jgi:ubiquinone/menaquinone biosynthesis C-methylase UbiE